MTLGTMINLAAAQLEKAGCPDSLHDARLLMEQCLESDYKGILLRWDESAEHEVELAYAQLVETRSSRRPLQYILGKWAFMGLEFYVGDGVLIPRQDSEILAQTVISLLKAGDERKKVIDLCAGTGCIGISVAYYAPHAEVWLIENSNDAFSFLEKNLSQHALPNAIAVKEDIMRGPEAFDIPPVDILVCNPPYIKTAQWAELQPEVRMEPITALDGGEDGLSYYRVLASKWLREMKKGDKAVFEIANDMAADAAEILQSTCESIQTLTDAAGNDRVLLLTI